MRKPLFFAAIALCSGMLFATEGAISTDHYTSAIDATTQPYNVYIPVGFGAANATTKRPAVIYLHGFGGRYTSTGVSGASKVFADAHVWLLAFPDGRGSVNYDHAGEEDVLRVRQDLINKYNADPDRIYLQGFSMGGHGTYRLAVRYPDLFAAANPQAGWTDYNDFYPQYYEQSSTPRLPSYIDPTRLPLLMHTAALPQVENGLPVAWRVFYNFNDTTNKPVNATRMLAAWTALHHPHVTSATAFGGHSPEENANAFPFFASFAVNHNLTTVVYNTERLRHNGAFWVHIEELTAREQPTRIQASLASSNSLAVQTTNVERFQLDPPAGVVGTLSSVSVDGFSVDTSLATLPVSLRRTRDGQGFPTGWQLAPGPLESNKKRKGREGPIDEATLGPFVVIYGTGNGQRAQNLNDAQLFCGWWNGRMILRWKSGVAPGNWWVTPYPGTFIVDAGIIPSEAIAPVSDTVAAGMDLTGKNLILFGDPSSNPYIDAIRSADQTPIKMSADGLRVDIGTRTYLDGGATALRYYFITPRADDPTGLALVSKGFLGSPPAMKFDGSQGWTSFDVSKDLEQMPWLFPDYVVWDANKPASGIVNVGSTYQYQPEKYLEAGFFTGTWALDDTAPNLRVTTTGTVDPADPLGYVGTVSLTAQACDGPGESGLLKLEYRTPSGSGAWQPYTAPITLKTLGSTSYDFRATDRGLSWQYGGSPVRVSQTFNNSVVTPATVKIDPVTVPSSGCLLRSLDWQIAGARPPNRFDTLSAQIDIGGAALSGSAANRQLTIQLGSLALGPFTTDKSGKFYARLPNGVIQGTLVSSVAVRRLVFTLQQPDLGTPLGLGTTTTGSFTFGLGLKLGATDLGTGSYTGALIHPVVNGPGMLQLRLP